MTAPTAPLTTIAVALDLFGAGGDGAVYADSDRFFDWAEDRQHRGIVAAFIETGLRTALIAGRLVDNADETRAFKEQVLRTYPGAVNGFLRLQPMQATCALPEDLRRQRLLDSLRPRG